MMAGTWVVIPEIRYCDLCKPPAPAYADGRTIYGWWANMCRPCFDRVGLGLGTGYGQEYLLEPPKEDKEEE